MHPYNLRFKRTNYHISMMDYPYPYPPRVGDVIHLETAEGFIVYVRVEEIIDTSTIVVDSFEPFKAYVKQ